MIARDSAISDPLHIIRLIENLESTGLIKCTTLSSSYQQLLDLRYKNNCIIKYLDFGKTLIQKEVISTNGTKWAYSIIYQSEYIFYASFYLFTLFEILIFLLIARNYQIRIKYINQMNTIYRQIAHDIRSPLEALKLASEKNLDTGITKMICERIQNLSNELLEASNQKSEKNKLMAITVSDLVKEVKVLTNEKSIEHPHINIKINNHDLSIINATIKIDLNQLKRIISNLINNCAESVSVKSVVVHFYLNSEISKITISISDDGNGFPNEIMSHNFKSINKASGHGIGLKHAYKTIKLMRGEINFKNMNGAVIDISFLVTNIVQGHSSQILILIDDDELNHLVISHRLKSKDIELKSYYSINSFLADPNLKDFMSYDIYLDSFFNTNGAQEKGEDRAKELYELGFKKIILTTSTANHHELKNDYIIRTISKEEICP